MSRTVRVKVLEATDVEVPEPGWCVDPHDGSRFRQDVTHNGREAVGTFEHEGRTVEFLSACISHAPFAELQPEPFPVVAVEVGGGLALGPRELEAFAEAVLVHAVRLQGLAAELRAIREATS